MEASSFQHFIYSDGPSPYIQNHQRPFQPYGSPGQTLNTLAARRVFPQPLACLAVAPAKAGH